MLVLFKTFSYIVLYDLYHTYEYEYVYMFNRSIEH